MKQIYRPNWGKILTIAFFQICNSVSAQTYCTTGLYTSGCNFFTGGDYIASFSTTGGSTNITNNNTNCGNLITAYTYYSGMTHTTVPGATVNFSFTNTPHWTQAYKIWVDWNQDQDFTDAGEEVYNSGPTQVPTSATVSGTFVVPLTATIGTTRLRIRCSDFATTATLTPCGSEVYGEVEDYNFHIVNPCTPLPTPPAVTSPINYCQGATAPPLTAAGSNLLWYTTAVGGVGTTVAPTPSTSTAGTTKYYVSQTVNGCQSLRDSITVNVIAATSPTASNNGPVCPGTILHLSATAVPGATYSWTGPNFTSSSQNPTIPNIQPVNGGVYSVVATVSGCASLPATTTVVVSPSPVISNVTAANPSGCSVSDGAFTIHGLTPGSVYLISYLQNGISQGPVTQAASASGTIIITGLPAATYDAITTSLNGCTSLPYGPVVLSNPSAPSAPVAGGNTPICEGGTINLTASTIPGATYSWSGPGSFSSTTQNPVISPATILASGTYFVTATVNGCTSPAGTVTIVVNAIPAAPVASSNSPVCEGANLTLNATTIPGASYSWTSPTFTSTVQNPTINSVGATNSGNYAVTATVNGCTSAPGSTSIIVSPVPVIANTTSTNPTTCSGSDGSISLTGLLPNTAYILNYTNNTTPSGPINVTSSATGSVVISGLPAGTYSAINLTSGNCTSPNAGPISLTDPAAPAVPVITSNSPVCEGGTINLNATSSPGASYSWSGPAFTASTQNISIPNAQTAIAGNYTVTATLNNCMSQPATTNVVVTQAPVIASTSFVNPSGCNATNGSISLTGLANNATYTINYTRNSVPQPPVTQTASTTGTVLINNLSAGTYTNITVTINGCQSADAGPITLTDPGNPTSPTVSNNGPLCSGATLSLAASTIPGATYSWTGPSFTSSQQNPTIPNVGVANSGQYSVTVTLNNCTSTPATTNVVVNPTPVITASSNAPLCEGGTLNLNATTVAGATYTWSGPAFTSTNQNATILNATTAMAGLYTAVASLNGCSDTSTANIVVNAIPTAPTASNVTICQASTASALTAAGQGLLWYTTPSGGTGSATAPVPSTATPGTNIWYVSQTVNGCESPRASITVTIIPKPQPPVVTPSVSYCHLNATAALTAAGQNILWYTTATGGTGSAVAPTPPASNTGTTTWYASQTIDGCESDRASITVTVHPIPAAPAVTSPVQYCIGDIATALTAQGQNLTWYTTATGGTGSTVAPVPNTSVTGSTSYYVSQTANGCESDRAEINVVVNENVSANISASTNSVCQYDTISLLSSASTPATATYNWNLDGGIAISGAAGGPYLVKWNTPGTKNISLTITNGNCVATDAVQVNVKPSPEALFELESDACLEEQITVQAAWNNLNNSAYTWSFDGATVISGSGPGAYKLQWNNTGAKVVSLITMENGCASEPHYDTIVIHEQPIADIKAEITSRICAGEVINLEAQGNGQGNYAYIWTPKEYFIVNGNAVAEATVKTTGLIYLNVTDPYGCDATDSVFVETKPCCEVYLPDAFTPNGDSRNDFFRLITQGHHKLSNFRVVNRWGQTVFEGGESSAQWDGTFGGVLQPVGTYFYFLKYQCGSGEIFEKKGEITLIR